MPASLSTSTLGATLPPPTGPFLPRETAAQPTLRLTLAVGDHCEIRDHSALSAQLLMLVLFWDTQPSCRPLPSVGMGK